MTTPEELLEQRIIGHSPAIRALRARILRYASTDLPVLIQGPSGSGKELVAEALHLSSGRGGSFVPFNVCAIAEPMFEDALFGHARGAFTGADRDRKGYLAEADRGTVFFDEIGGLPIAMQIKLLRAVETRRFRPVGASADVQSDFRLIAASNDDVLGLVSAGRFRVDLAHRLNALTVSVPPLSARRGDIPLLARHFAARRSIGQVPAPLMTPAAESALQTYEWPGNVRELQHIVACALLEAGDEAVTARHIGTALANGGRAATGLNEFTAAERRALLRVLGECDWDTVAAAERLGVNRATVYRRMRRLGIAVPVEVKRAPWDGASPPSRAAATGAVICSERSRIRRRLPQTG